MAETEVQSEILEPDIPSPRQSKSPTLKETLVLIKPRAASFCALHFYTSKFMEYNRQPKQLEKMVKDAATAFASLNGIVFQLKNDDILCIAENKSIIMVERAISIFRRLLPTDPLITSTNTRDMFLLNYDLGFQWRDFCINVTEIEDNPAYSIKAKNGQSDISSPLIIDGIGIQTLSMIENILKQSDASNYIRRQSIHWYDGKENPKPLSQHFYFSLPDLQNALKISESLSGNTWLFRQITIYLDRQMIKVLPTIIQQKSSGSLNINLNLRSLVTSHFQNFLQNFKTYSQGKSLTICFDLVDAIAHADVLQYGITLLNENNIKTCINNINPVQMGFIKLKEIPVDQFKINNSDLFQNRLDEVKMMIKEIGGEKFTLHRADDEKNIQSGLSVGITHFQGRGIDKLRSKSVSSVGENDA